MLELHGEPGIARAWSPPWGHTVGRLVRLQHLVLARNPPTATPSTADIEALARALIGPHEAQAHGALARLAEICGDERRLMLEGLAPAARRLGVWWSEDECDFLEVSEALARLGAILASLSAPEPAGLRAPTMLMLTPPGETHRFGADMAADLFRREGWRVLRADAKAARLDEGGYDAIGISCGCERAATGLPRFLAEIRALTRERPPPILLGGALFNGHGERARSLKVDFVASDADSPQKITRAMLHAGSV